MIIRPKPSSKRCVLVVSNRDLVATIVSISTVASARLRLMVELDGSGAPGNEAESR